MKAVRRLQLKSWLIHVSISMPPSPFPTPVQVKCSMKWYSDLCTHCSLTTSVSQNTMQTATQEREHCTALWCRMPQRLALAQRQVVQSDQPKCSVARHMAEKLIVHDHGLTQEPAHIHLTH